MSRPGAPCLESIHIIYRPPRHETELNPSTVPAWLVAARWNQSDVRWLDVVRGAVARLLPSMLSEIGAATVWTVTIWSERCETDYSPSTRASETNWVDGFLFASYPLPRATLGLLHGGNWTWSTCNIRGRLWRLTSVSLDLPENAEHATSKAERMTSRSALAHDDTSNRVPTRQRRSFMRDVMRTFCASRHCVDTVLTSAAYVLYADDSLGNYKSLCALSAIVLMNSKCGILLTACSYMQINPRPSWLVQQDCFTNRPFVKNNWTMLQWHYYSQRRVSAWPPTISWRSTTMSAMFARQLTIILR